MIFQGVGGEVMYKITIFLLVFIAWFLVFLVFKNSKMYFLKFLAGSVGVFTICMIFFMPYLEGALNLLISNTLAIIGRGIRIFEVFKDNSIISIDTKDGIVAMVINYECSGVIEMLVFTSLAFFFPFGGFTRKSLSLIFGNIYIFASNIIRILFIAGAVKLLGASSYYLVHTLLARILFFGLTVLLYYYTFTSTQLKYQKVGEI